MNMVLRKFSLGFGKSKVTQVVEPESPEILSNVNEKPKFNRHVHISKSISITRKPELLLSNSFRGRNKSDSDLRMLRRWNTMKNMSRENLFSGDNNHVVWLEALMENIDSDEKTDENKLIVDEDIFEDALETTSPACEYDAKISKAIWYVDFAELIQEKDMHLDNEDFVDLLYERAKHGPVTEL